MKTILHLIDTTGPGGAETIFIDLATRLPKDEYRSIVVIRGKGWVYDELCRRGISPVLIDAKGSFNWRYLFRLCKLIKQEKVGLIQSHLLGSNVYSSLAGLLTRTPVVATFHGAVDVGDEERFKWLKFMVINSGSRSVVAVSDNLRRDLMARTPIKQKKIKVIYNGISTADFQRPHNNDIRKQFGWSNESVIIGSLGNIRTAKGYDILLRAAALLKNNATSFQFVIAGQGAGGLYDRLLELRAELGLDETVHFFGFVDDPAAYLANLDFFLLSSTSEGFSIATIQAMASKLPILATRSGGPEEIITHGENGWLIEVGNPQAMAEGIERLVTDKDLATTLAKKGNKHVMQTFDIGVMLSAYKALYEI